MKLDYITKVTHNTDKATTDTEITSVKGEVT